MDSPQRLVVDEPLQSLDTQRELPECERPLVSQPTLPKAREVRDRRVVSGRLRGRAGLIA